MNEKYTIVYDVIFVTDHGSHLIIFSSLDEQGAESMREWYCSKHGYDKDNPTITYISEKKVFNHNIFVEDDYKEYLGK